MMRKSDLPSLATRLECEQALWSAGMPFVAGVDEVGRGALAGPLIAAAVILPQGVSKRTGSPMHHVVDSKLLSPIARQRLAPFIWDIAIAVGIGIVEADELDSVGLAAANRMAMERAVTHLPVDPDALLLDAAITDLGLPQIGLIDGDARCLSIAAASIVAKVLRDRRMEGCHEVDGRYGFHQHKGYGTADHLCALRQHGPSCMHRHSFAPVAQCTVVPH